MTRPNSAILLAALLAMVAVLGGIGVAKGGFYLGKHEGDTLHFLEIVGRMLAGEVPHLDFMTPIGALAFAPVAGLLRWGLTIGDAILWSQVLAALAILPAVWWVAATRLTLPVALLFGLIQMVLMLALVHGEAERTISISMHYNRWAWAAAFLAILAALIPPARPSRGTVDGVIIGAAITALVLIKVTYVAAFAVPVALGLWLTGQRRALGVAVVTGLALAAVLTVWLGPGYWLAYLADLRTVSGSEVRPQPGEDFGAVIVAPAYKGASLLVFASVILLRRAGRDTEGLLLLLMIPGFFYVSFQNFGNDPQWLYLLAVLLLALRPAAGLTGPFGWDMRQALTVAGAMAAALAMPSFFNLVDSPLRHWSTETADYVPLVPGDPRLADLRLAEVRATRVDARVGMDGDGSGLEAYRDRADRDPEITFMGDTFPYCTTELGLPAMLEAIAADIDAAGLGAGKSAFAADLFTTYWLYGDMEPVRGGAPWFYGGLPGYENADYLLIPLCPLAGDVQAQILKLVEEAGTDDLTEVRRTPLYILYARG